MHRERTGKKLRRSIELAGRMEESRRSNRAQFNEWDCNQCRTQGLDKTRACTLHQNRFLLRDPVPGWLTRDEVIADSRWDHLWDDIEEHQDFEGRPVCPVGLVVRDVWVRTILAHEADTKEYQIDPPSHLWLVSAYRIIRAARAQVQERADIARQEQIRNKGD